MKEFWNERYAGEDFAYGTKPNEFLVSAAQHLKKPSDILTIGEGEGRNAVFLASKGHRVVATDQSDIGMAKAQKRAEKLGYAITTVVADLAAFDFGSERYDAIVSIFCHLPAELRKSVHSKIKAALRKGGIYIIESYSPDQLSYNSGGPKDASWLVTLDELKNEFVDFEWVHHASLVRDVVEGAHHTGPAAVTQFIGRKK